MIKAEVIHPSQLGDQDRAAWQAWRPRAHPLLGPDFAELVGRLRCDARVALIDLDGARAGFFAFHQRPGHLARSIGAPFSDYCAIAARPGVRMPMADVLRATGLTAFRFSGLIGEAEDGVVGEEGFAIEEGGEAYLSSLDAKRLKNWRRLSNKIEREIGPLRLEMDDRDPLGFDQLLSWKRDQLRRSGLHDFLHAPWSRALMRSLFEQEGGAIRGRMLTLRAGGRLLAGHFGVEAEGVCHSWVSSIAPDAHAWSPGQVVLAQAIAAMPASGLKVLDLGPSHAHYKAPFCKSRVQTRQGTVTAGRLAEAAEQVWSLAARAAPACAAARRRLDHIAAVELSAAGRLKGVLDALCARTRPGRATAPAEV